MALDRLLTNGSDLSSLLTVLRVFPLLPRDSSAPESGCVYVVIKVGASEISEKTQNSDSGNSNTQQWERRIMKFIFFFIYFEVVFSARHKLSTHYEGIIHEDKSSEFSAFTELDGERIYHYDSVTEKLIHGPEWMEEYSREESWRTDTEIMRQTHPIFLNNIHELMKRFKQTNGDHAYVRTYGCVWDDETKDTDHFDQYFYDTNDFIILDFRTLRYSSPLAEGQITVEKWNKEEIPIDYYKSECITWLKKFLQSKIHSRRIDHVDNMGTTMKKDLPEDPSKGDTALTLQDRVKQGNQETNNTQRSYWAVILACCWFFLPCFFLWS
ncbi:hypothetical protein DNTS_025783 [Danionella cerebrum]|uniref:MHC class I-like antigen recognition-like domain-containing protein n=1 Tax=Danionella cerebrum TaxID=2873325 RepID=A0A553N4L3_9TELE|nr:hypothetical protein DNTS_025783 [Danionella translucida]